MQGTARTRLEALASYLQGEFIVRDRERGRTDRHGHGSSRHKSRAPGGDREPIISCEQTHLTISWVGNRAYHKAVWNDQVRFGKAKKIKTSSDTRYDIVVFYKAAQDVPRAWENVMAAAGREGADGGELDARAAWQDIPDNYFVALTKNDNTAPATCPGEVNSDTAKTLAVLGHEDAAEQGRWFAFPGIYGRRKSDRSARGDGAQTTGQVAGRVPGAKHGSRDASGHKVKKNPVGECFFRDDSDLATAILTKIYPLDGAATSAARPTSMATTGKVGAAFLVAGAVTFMAWSANIINCAPCQTLQTFISGQQLTGTERAQDEMMDFVVAPETASPEMASREMIGADIQQTMSDLAKSPALPPCWMDAKGKRPEFLFDAYIEKSGVRLVRAAPAHRSADYVALGIAPRTVGKVMRVGEFRDTFGQLAERSLGTNGSKCRHFARVYEGNLERNELFDARLDAVEDLFYTFRPLPPQ